MPRLVRLFVAKDCMCFASDSFHGIVFQGDCDSDSDCQGDLKCMQRDGKEEEVPGCRGNGSSGIDYCYNPSELKVVGNKQEPPTSQTSEPLLMRVGHNGSPSGAFPLKVCQG
jgi:hypothetical protein